MLYFFLSYGWNDDNPFVERFFVDLSKEVRIQAGISGNPEVGFLDRATLRQGRPIFAGITNALAECRTFVPLYSPRFFTSENCGQEWEAFDRRLARQAEIDGRRPDGFLPVMWRPCSLPPIAAQYQDKWTGFDDAHRRQGLSHLYRLRGEDHEDFRTLFVEQLAAEIVRIADQEGPLIAGDPLVSVRRMRSALDPVRSTQLPRPDRQRGPAHLQLVLAGAGRTDMSDVRDVVSCYGSLVEDWCPYHPDAERVVDVIRECGAEKGFRTELAGVEGLGAQLVDAWRHHEVVALVADPWAPFLAGHGEELTAFDSAVDEAGKRPTTPMWVPWSRVDDETQQRRDELVQRLAGVMPGAAERGLVDRTDLGSAAEFTRSVAREIGSAWDTMVQTGQPTRTVLGEQPPEPPVIEVP